MQRIFCDRYFTFPLSNQQSVSVSGIGILKTRISAVLTHHLAILGLALLPWPARALDVGTLHWKAAANQPPYVEIELRDKARLEASAIRASLGTREAYAAAGLTYHPGLAMLRITVQAGPDGLAMLKLEQLPQDVDSLDLLIVVSNRLGIALAEYRVLPLRGSQDISPSPAGTMQLKVRSPGVVETGKTPSAAPPPVDPDISAARQAIKTWALAWSQRNVDEYIATYTADYPGAQSKMPRQTWLDQRRALIMARKHISVELSDIHLKRQGDRFVASFVQRYRSDGPSDLSRKRLVLALEDGHWRIQQETAWHLEAPPAGDSTASQTQALQVLDKDKANGQSVTEQADNNAHQ